MASPANWCLACLLGVGRQKRPFIISFISTASDPCFLNCLCQAQDKKDGGRDGRLLTVGVSNLTSTDELVC